MTLPVPFTLYLLFLLQAQKPPGEYLLREGTLKHVVYAPRNLEPGRKYPFTIYLHGSCDVCTTHERIMQESGLRIWHGYDRNVQR